MLSTPTLIFAGAVAIGMSRLVDHEYIDEIFHVTQTRHFHTRPVAEWVDAWDPKITTPPGLYLVALAYARVAGLFVDGMALWVLRLLNWVGGLVVLPWIVSTIPGAHPTNVATLPLLFTYNFLFYTDVWSTVVVVAALAAALHRRPWASGALAWVSLWFRQTNVIWAAFIYAVAASRVPLVLKRQIGGFDEITSTVKSALRFSYIAAYGATFASFIAFMIVNGGITLGDKSNHQVSAHGMQLVYCAVFVSGLTWPVWLSKAKLRHYLSFLTLYGGAPSAILLAAVVYVSRTQLVVHPFLLADNRHYTFYLYRRLLSKPLLVTAAAPAFHFCLWNAFHSVYRNLGPVSTLALAVAWVLTLVPSPLFEPRYYIVPLVVFRLFARSQRRDTLEWVWYMAVNAAVFAVFFSYTFDWATEAHPQRIIW